MHLGNGVVTPACAMLGLGTAGASIAWSLLAVRRQRSGPEPWRLAAATAAVFALQTANVTVLAGQSSGHFMGGVLLALWFGPAWGLLSMSAVLGVQSICFADGGLLSLGLNIVNMGVVPCLLVYPLWRRLAGSNSEAPHTASVAVAAWAAVVGASILATLELLTTQALGDVAALATVMLGVHALIGLLEAGVTVAALGVARRMTAMNTRTAAVITAMLVAGVVLLADRFASPFPDGLEFSLASVGLSERLAALAQRVESMQATLAPWPGYGVVWGSFAGCAITALVGFSAVRVWTAAANREGVRQA